MLGQGGGQEFTIDRIKEGEVGMLGLGGGRRLAVGPV
jgi:hypothetical protein